MKGAAAALEGVAADGSLHLRRFMTAKHTQIPFRVIKSLEDASFARQEAKCPWTVRPRVYPSTGSFALGSSLRQVGHSFANPGELTRPDD